MSLDLTIVIPVKNEERNLPGCLDAIGDGFAAQVVLVDSGSTDGTKAIAAQRGVPVIDFQWDGRFPKKRNWYLRHHTPATQWVLFLDADEYLTPPVKKEMTQALTQPKDKVGFWLSYTIYFMGKPLKHGYPLTKLALFRVGAGEYERIDEDQWSRLDMEIHEHPQLDGAIGEIRAKIDHRDFRGIDHYNLKHHEYAAWEAARFAKDIDNPEKVKSWTWKQRLKYRLIGSPLIGPAYFLGSYVGMGGFLDGARGFAFAILKMSYFTQIYCRIKERDV